MVIIPFPSLAILKIASHTTNYLYLYFIDPFTFCSCLNAESNIQKNCLSHSLIHLHTKLVLKNFRLFQAVLQQIQGLRITDRFGMFVGTDQFLMVTHVITKPHILHKSSTLGAGLNIGSNISMYTKRLQIITSTQNHPEWFVIT